MPRTPRSVARRLERLWRRAHRFHRFAHHPLCGAYAGEVLQIGKRGRVCRGCACSAGGVLLGGMLSAGTLGSEALLDPRLLGAAVWNARATATAAEDAIGTGHALRIALGVVLGIVVAVALIAAPRARVWPRPGKLVTRLLPASLLAFGFGYGVLHARAGGLLLALGCALGGAAAIMLYRVRGPDRSPCESCPERSEARVCSGFLPIVSRERALLRVSRRWLATQDALERARTPNEAAAAAIARAGERDTGAARRPESEPRTW